MKEYKTKEFAAEISCSHFTVRNWRFSRNGQPPRLLPARYEGGKAIYTEEQIPLALALLGKNVSATEDVSVSLFDGSENNIDAPANVDNETRADDDRVIDIALYNTFMLWAEKISNGQHDAVYPFVAKLKETFDFAADKEEIIDVIKTEDLNGARRYLAQFNFVAKDDTGSLLKLVANEVGEYDLIDIPADVTPEKEFEEATAAPATDAAPVVEETDGTEDDDFADAPPVFVPTDDSDAADDENVSANAPLADDAPAKGINLLEHGFADVETKMPDDSETVDANAAVDTPAEIPVSSPTTDKQTRIAEAERFFDLLFGKIPAPHFSYLAKFKNGTEFPDFAVADKTQRAAMARKAIELSDKGVDIWHAVNPVSVKPKGGKRGKEDVVSFQTAIVTDIDIFGAAHKSENLAADFDEAKSFLPFPPSILIDSGHGLQAYYLFDAPLAVTDDNREEIKRRNKLLLDVIRARASGKAIDAVDDLPRILRTPGTFNYKLGKDNAPLCHVVEVNDIRFTPADMDERLAALTPQLTAPIEPARATDSKVADVGTFTADAPLSEDSPELKSFRIRHMLPCISVVKGEYNKWLQVGMGLYNEGLDCADWEQWSRTQPEFKEGECADKWTGFSTRNDGIRIGTLYQWAIEGGYDEKDVQRQWYQLHPELSKKNDTAAQIEELKAALRENAKALDDFNAQRDAALERLKNVEVFDSDTCLADDVIEAAAFAKLCDMQALSEFKRAIKVYGQKHKETVVNANDFRDCVKAKYEELEARLSSLTAQGVSLQAQIKSAEFIAADDDLRGVKIPDNYAISGNGIWLVAGESLIPVARLPVIIKGKSFDVDAGNYKLILSYKPKHGKWKRLPAQEAATVFDKRNLVGLVNKGLPVTSTTAKLLVDYLDAFIAKNEDSLPLSYIVGRGGWHEFNDSEYFIDPRRPCVFTNADGKQISVEVDSSSQFAKSLRSKGTLAEWKRAYDLAKPSPVARLMVAASVAAPLLRVLGERNFLLYVYAPTRAGKTTALCLGGSAVGSEKVIRSFDSTRNGLNGAAADVCDFPFIVDEKQVADSRLKEQLDNLVYSLANGVGRTKLNKDSTLKDLPMWRTIALMTGETQMLNDNVTGGANTRLLSIAAPKVILPADTCKKIRDIIADNYGHVMPLVVDKINTAGKQKLRDTYQKNVETFMQKCPDVLPEYCRYMAILTLADALLNSALGTADTLTAYDDAIINAAKIFKLIPTAAEIDDSNAEKDLVVGFIAVNQNRFIGEHNANCPPMPAYGKLADNDGYTYITSFALKECCKNADFDFRKLVADLVGIGFFVPNDKIKKGHKKPLKTVQKAIGKLKPDCYRIPNRFLNTDE